MANHLSFFQQQLRREINGKYRGASPLWILLQPLMLLAVYSFVFTHIFQARIPANLDASFILYLALAYWPWSAFSETVLRNMTVINEHAGLIKKVVIKRELFVVARTCGVFTLHLIGFISVLLVLTVLGHSIQWLYLPLAIIFLLSLAVFACAISLFVSATQVIVPALSNVIQPLILLTFFSTPILWAPEMLPERFRVLLAWNPFAWWVTNFRALLLEGHLPSGLSSLGFILGIVLTVLIGHWFFNRLNPFFEDYL